MIKRLTLLCMMWLCVGIPVFAGPVTGGPFARMKKFVQEHPRFTAIVATDVLATVAQYEGTKYCHQPGSNIERCDLGYGLARRHNLDWIGVTADAVGLPVAEACWKDNPDWKFCYVLAYGGAAYQVTVAVHDFTQYEPERKKVDEELANRFFKMPKL